MATSGSKSVTVTKWDTLTFSWELASQDVNTNTSIINWKMTLTTTGYGRIDSTRDKDWSVTIDNAVYSGENRVGIGNNSTKTLASAVTSIPHSDDGTATFTYSFSQQFDMTFSDNHVGTLTGSGTAELPTIARASQPSCVTWPEHTQNVGSFGDTISVHMNRKSSDFTHTVRYQFGSRSGTIATGVGTGTTWTIPASLMTLIPDATSGSGTIYVDTYNGSTLVGTRSCGFTATVPATVKPTCSLSLDDTTGVDDIYGSPVRGLSKIRVRVTATSAYSSEIVSYTVTANGVTYTGADVTTDVLKTAGTSRVTATVKDARGRTGTTYYDMSVQAYNPPVISRLSVHRCDADGTENDQGEYCLVLFSAAVSSMSGKNTAAYTLKYKKTAESAWTEVALTDLRNTYTQTDASKVFAADGNNSYDVGLVVADRHGSATRDTSMSTAFTLFNCHPSGTGWRFGGVAEKENTLQNDLALCQTGNSYAFQPDAFGGAKGYTLLATITLTALNVNAPIVFTINRRGATCPMTVYARFASSSTTLDPDLASFTYDGDNYGAFMVKSAASTWELYVDNITGWSNPCLQSWYTTDSQKGRMSLTFSNEQVEGTEPSVLGTYYRAVPAKMRSILDFIYPVGSVYISYSHSSPEQLFGGTWERIENAFLWATDAAGAIGQTGGESEHTLTIDEMPTHNHWPHSMTSDAATHRGYMTINRAEGTSRARTQVATSSSSGKYAITGASSDLDWPNVTQRTGGGLAHNNMPPYIQVSVWRRTA